MAFLRTTTLTIVMIVAVVSAGCAGRDVRGPFRNQYIDAETGKPIEGVVFLAVWNSVTPTPTGDGGQSFYDAREVVSGADGRVELPPLMGPIWRLGLNVRFYEIANGYVRDRQDVSSDGQRYFDQTLTYMRRPTTPKEQCERLRMALPSVPANTNTIPLYLAAFRKETGTFNC